MCSWLEKWKCDIGRNRYYALPGYPRSCNGVMGIKVQQDEVRWNETLIHYNEASPSMRPGKQSQLGGLLK